MSDPLTQAIATLAVELKRYNDRAASWDAELRQDMKIHATTDAGVISLVEARKAQQGYI